MTPQGGGAPTSTAPATPKFRGGTFGRALEGGLKQSDRADVEAFMREVSTFTHERSGLTVTPTSVTVNKPFAGLANVDVQYEIRDRDGKVVGKAWRQWYPADPADGTPARVDHMSMELAPSAQGNGFATAWNQRMEDVYRANGVREIQLTANEDVGGYAWAKQGYTWFGRQTVDEYAKIMDLVVKSPPGSWSAEDVAQVRAMAKRMRSTDPAKVPTPLEISMIGWTPGAKMWPGKGLMLGSSWEGVKKL